MALQYPEIDPVAFAVGPLEIRWYALAYLVSFMLAWQYALFLAGRDISKEPRENFIHKTDIDDFLPWAILGVILGGRIGYVLFYQLEWYLADPMEIAKVWKGGMSFHGGAIGVILAMIGYSVFYKRPLLRLTDIVCCTVPIGLFFGRIANFVNGELFGRPAPGVPWAMKFPQGGLYPRHPSQLYEAALEGLVLFAVLFLLARVGNIRNRPGILSAVFLAGYALARSFIEFYREPDVQIGLIADQFTMGQILCVPMFIGAVILFGYARHNEPHK